MNKRILVVHHSRYGASETYAQAIAEKLNAPYKPLKALKKHDLDNIDTLIYGAGIYVSKIRGLSKLNKYLVGRSVVTHIFAVGLSDRNEETISKIKTNNVDALTTHSNELHYFTGDFDTAKLSFFHRGLMRVLRKVLSSKESLTEEESGLLSAIETPVKGINTESITRLTDTL